MYLFTQNNEYATVQTFSGIWITDMSNLGYSVELKLEAAGDEFKPIR